MLRKELFSPERVGQLLTHWHTVDQEKYLKLSRASLRSSRFDKSTLVLSTAPILIFRYYKHFKQYDYVIHGRHRALASYKRNVSAEGCVVFGMTDITHHTPRECLIEGDLERTLSSFEFRFDAIRYSQMDGVMTIAELAAKYVA